MLPTLVLDTNAVLDWLYFRDPRCRALDEAVAAGRVRWIATIAMGDELGHVLARGELDAARWPDGAASTRSGWLRWASVVETPARAPLFPRCSDADDQKFIDLALAARASALLSADRAVLRLAKRARAWGVAISTVERWTFDPDSAATP